MGLDINQRQMAWNVINLAKRELEKGDYDSVHMANYILRDLDATKEAKLSDLSWAIHRGNAFKNDVLGLIEHLENHLLLLDKIERENTGYDYLAEYSQLPPPEGGGLKGVEANRERRDETVD